MRIATFNVENMFVRAKALNGATWAEGKPALEAHKALNALFENIVYSSADKTRMLALLKANGLLKSDEGPLMRLRKIRGQLITRPRTGEPEIVASGRASWIGWVELKTEPVNEAATQNTARVIASLNAELLGVMEAEDRTTLRLFNEQVLGETSINHILFSAYHHVMLVDGNDDRGIDVGLLTRRDYPVVSIRSHVHDAVGPAPTATATARASLTTFCCRPNCSTRSRLGASNGVACGAARTAPCGRILPKRAAQKKRLPTMPRCGLSWLSRTGGQKSGFSMRVTPGLTRSAGGLIKTG